MAEREVVKGRCEITGCLYDVYTKGYIDKNMGTMAARNYSRGTSEPSGGKDGDIYDQYFN